METRAQHSAERKTPKQHTRNEKRLQSREQNASRDMCQKTRGSEIRSSGDASPIKMERAKAVVLLLVKATSTSRKMHT